MTIFADELLTPSGWVRNARVEIEGGRISAITENAALQPDDERHGIVLPGVPNVHSHAFQRAMAGLAEQPGPGSDNFWSWRDIMYRFALAFEPEDLEAVASQLYVEMLEAGFTRVGEFHYLHHASDGGHYGAIAEMAGRIVAASGETGIGLTLLPVFYAHSNFGGAAPNDGQRRFINSLDSFERLLEGCRTALSGKANSRLGIAPHSLRAVTGDELSALTGMDFSGPVHIHAAEQTKEVEESIAFSGKRPVEWLLDNADFKRQWCFIHATHMTESETLGMAANKVVAGLCPITEANLGDGFFPAEQFIQAGGAFGVGSDSNVLIGVSDELRQLEYSRRLYNRARNVLAFDGKSTGRTLFDGAVAGGARSMGVESGIAVGHPADFVALKPRHEAGFTGDKCLDSWIFANGMNVDCVWVSGVKQVEGGRHNKREEIAGRFSKTMKTLMGRL